MNWVDIAWPMLSATSLTLGLIHGLTWLKQRRRIDHLALATICISVGTIAIFELLSMRSQTPAHYGALLRWAHVWFALMFVGIVYFLRARFDAGRRSLGVAVIVTRLGCLVPNFLDGANLNFRTIDALEFVHAGNSGPLAVPVGKSSSWMLLGFVSVVLLLAYIADVMATVWRRNRPGERRSVLLICGSMSAFMLLAAIWVASIALGVVHAPVTLTPAFVGVLFVMSYDLGTTMLRNATLAQKINAAQASLRASEERMELAARAAGIGVWSLDLRNGALWLSEPGKRLFGFEPGARIERETLLERIHPNDHGTLRSALQQARESGQYACEYRVTAAQGQVRWLSARGHIDGNEKGAPVFLRGAVADITERKQAQERFRTVFETAQTAMLMVDTGGRITLANHQADIVFGYARAELIGMNVDSLVPMRARVWHAGERTAYAAHAKARAMGAGRELFALRKDGTELPVEIGLSPVRSDRGLFVLASISDVSERKRADRELAVQRDELAHLSRVVLLAELSGSLAHELNQPLTAILSNAQAAARFLTHTPPNLVEVQESLANIIDNDKRAGEVIRRLRAMLRKERADHRRLDVNDVVLDVLRIIRSDLLNRNVELDLALDPKIPPVVGDRVQLQQVLLNLVMNAIDATATITGVAMLHVRTATNAAGEVEVAVRDNGCGIAEQDTQQIFSPFVTSKPDGMGLGLVVCSSIIRGHGGTIDARNNADGGATVRFSIPALGIAERGID